ncbi:MAG: F0F1 ATP synthase subunit B [Armatimonadota bacterium]|jgi:F-type H+-transporting ATPase subunit b
MGETTNPLAIDWVVLSIQVVGFVILFLLLRRYLFGPLMSVITQRQQEIAEGLEAGERARTELARIDQERAQALAEAREQGREQVRQAVREGEHARERIVTEAREEAQALRQRAQQAIALERDEAELALRQQVVDLALMAADKAVLRRLDTHTQKQVIDDFITSLEQQ